MFRFLWRVISSNGTRWIGGLVIAVLGIYGTFFFERKAELSYEVLSSANVLDIRESLTKLAIVYDGTDLRATNQNLHLLVLRIVNQGTADILKSSFDEMAPLGFKVSVGKIVETPTVVADTYLKEHLRTSVKDERTVTFAPVILNAGESFQVRTLLLIPQGQTPNIIPMGKVAGIRAIHVVPVYEELQNRSYYQEAFAGNSWVQLGRTVVYFLAMLLTLALLAAMIGIPASKISDRLSRSRRSKQVKRYREAIDRRLSLKEEYLVDQYVDDSPVFHAFSRIVRPLSPEENRSLAEIERMVGEGFALRERQSLEPAHKELESNGLIVRDGPQIEAHADVANSGRDFVLFVAPTSDDEKRNAVSP